MHEVRPGLEHATSALLRDIAAGRGGSSDSPRPLVIFATTSLSRSIPSSMHGLRSRPGLGLLGTLYVAGTSRHLMPVWLVTFQRSLCHFDRLQVNQVGESPLVRPSSLKAASRLTR